MPIASTGYSPTWPGGIKLGSHREKTLLAAGAATGAAVPWGGGKGLAFVGAAVWNGATATMQFRMTELDPWVAVPNCAFTADDMEEFDLPVGFLRCAITVAVPTGVTMKVSIVDRL